jgi:hypothetical protein
VNARTFSVLPGCSGIISRVKQGAITSPGLMYCDDNRRGWANFIEVYRPLADQWTIYDNSESPPKRLERGP